MRVENDLIKPRQVDKMATPARFKVALFVNLVVVAYLVYLKVAHGGKYLTDPYSYELRKTVERVGCLLLTSVAIIALLPAAFRGDKTQKYTAIVLGIFPLGVAYHFWSEFVSEFLLR
ncbi:MAG: hypothetical protein JWN25_1053 [Verrucomicrobiales bacterium]|nr:hypothetical protein [Verrucomicrobiales bacterium]